MLSVSLPITGVDPVDINLKEFDHIEDKTIQIGENQEKQAEDTKVLQDDLAVVQDDQAEQKQNIKDLQTKLNQLENKFKDYLKDFPKDFPAWFIEK